MLCDCKNACMITDGDKITYMEKESLIQLKLDIMKWKTLYKCKFCNTFWEESFIEDRFVGIPQLIKVDKDYVEREWKVILSEL